ncbi:hypothetical protein ATI61_111199 [Archangium gephyra]|uniref:Uncharacterized protein n=1 Tax=Archangium gephyra TaxID=48 RepID=A0AAC8QGX7_9BACT|nr:hypothetical protein [Archangium gephyra]AKJ07241.1 Hypothetical protein AA314_08867 [Archangium gephyra]REG26649.1 hypothetical protein ATI61_111199 [Archangium gephyra]
MTISLSFPLSQLELVGYIGRFQPKDWPVRLLPVYRSQSQSTYLLPPMEEEVGALRGRLVSKERLADLEEEGELTLLSEPKAAQGNHLLWMDETGPRYMPREEAESALDERCAQTVIRAMEMGLHKRAAREYLFRSLRARPTAVVNALLSLHFQLLDDIDQVKPLREDLARMARSRVPELEQRLMTLVTSSGKGFSREEATAVASELRRAQRESLAKSLLDTSQIRDPSRWAAEPAVELRWGSLGRVPS